MEPTENNINKFFFERTIEDAEEGGYDDRGFFCTPNGSFWDDNDHYFNHEGFDIHGGSYDKYGMYHPGPNFLIELNCYADEIDPSDLNNEEFKKRIIQNYEDELKEELDLSKDEFVEEDDKEGNDTNNAHKEYTLDEMNKIFNEVVKENMESNINNF